MSEKETRNKQEITIQKSIFGEIVSPLHRLSTREQWQACIQYVSWSLFKKKKISRLIDRHVFMLKKRIIGLYQGQIF